MSLIQSMAEQLFAAPWVGLVATLAVAAPFLISGIGKLLNFPGAVGEVRQLTGIEPAAPIAGLVVLPQLGGSALLIAGGRYAWIGALALAGFTTIATCAAHAFWLKSPAEQSLHRNI